VNGVVGSVGTTPATRRPPFGLSHPEKTFWPDEGYTKLDLANFYARVFPKLAPYVRDRLLALERCPEGLHGECFFQKEKPVGLPEDTPTRRILHQRGITNYVVGGRRETLIALANLGCIAVHVWSSRARAPRKPDWVCFDLDPASGRFADAVGAALRVKDVLDALALTSFPKTSGGKGLHILVPIRSGPDAEDVLKFAQRVGARLAAAFPAQLTVEARLRDRGARVYLDPFRNAFAQTVVAPYSVRCRPHAPVSTPLAWSEVKPGLDPDSFTLGNFEKRLGRQDPWDGFFRSRQSFPAAESALARL
jgi:bifunctional non-homologous end joining protein LigD